MVGAWKGTAFHLDRQIGQQRFPCLTLLAIQTKWKEWEHSAVKMAWPCPALTLLRQMAQFFLERRELKLRESLEMAEEEEEEKEERDEGEGPTVAEISGVGGRGGRDDELDESDEFNESL